MSQESHPARATLDDFLNGRVDDASSREIELHLEGCAECCQALAQLSARTDEFVQLVSEAGATGRIGDSSLEKSSSLSIPISGHVGRFEVRGHIGHGGFGVVLAAHDPRLHREVAVKVPRLGSLLAPNMRDRFLREARAAAALDHPNILPIYEAGEADGLCYIASAFCRGPTLSEWLKQRNEPVPFRTAAWLVAELAAAVEHAHSRGVLHRDLKPANVLLEPDGDHSSHAPEAHSFPFVPRISDFGLAKLQNEDADATQGNVVMGTPSYMAPEQAYGWSHNVGPAADVYALGAILYELITGRPPFTGDSELETLVRVRKEEPVPPVSLRPRTPRDLETICLRCLDKEPHRRFRSAGELAADLRLYLAGKPICARPIGSVAKSARWCRRNPVVAGLTGSLLGALVLIAIGSTVMSVRFNRQYHRAADAERDSKQHLWQSYLAGIQAGRTSKMAGQRFNSLAVLSDAVQLAAELELDDKATLRMRNEAIACLLLADLRLESQWPAAINDMDPALVSFDRDLQRFAFHDGEACIVRNAGASSDALRFDDAGGAVQRLELSPHGRFLAAIAQADETSHVCLWDLQDSAKKRRSIDVAQPACIGFDHAEKSLAIVDQSGALSICDLATGRLTPGAKVDLSPRGCRFDSRGGRIAVWGGSRVDIFDVREKRVTHQLSYPGDDQILCADFSPEGAWLAAGGSHHLAYLWYFHEPSPRYILRGHQGWVTNVAFISDGSLLATSGSDGTTRLWRAWTGAEQVAGRGYFLRFSHDGQRLGGLLGGGLAIYSVAGEKERRTFRASLSNHYEANMLEISPDGKLLASCHANGIDIWRLDAGKHLAQLALPGTNWLRFRREGSEIQLLIGTEQGVHSRTVNFDPANARLQIGAPEPIEFLEQFRSFRNEVLSDNGRILALANVKGDVLVADLHGKIAPVTINHHQAEIPVISADGRRLATFTFNQRGMEVWDATNGKHVHSLATESPVLAANFRPDNKWLAVDGDSALTFYKAGSWSKNHQLTWDDVAGVSLSHGGMLFTADGELLAVHRGGYEVRLVRAADGRLLATLTTEAPYAHYSFSHDGRHLATIGPDLTIQLWDLALIRERLKELGLDWQ
jgi:WD40 repeat protein